MILAVQATGWAWRLLRPALIVGLAAAVLVLEPSAVLVAPLLPPRPVELAAAPGNRIEELAGERNPVVPAGAAQGTPVEAEGEAGPSLWLSQQEIDALPMSGPAWRQLQAAADGPQPEPRIGDKDDDADVLLLARALVYARTGRESYRRQVLDGLRAAMASTEDRRSIGILAVARNTPPYVIAADLIDLSADSALDRDFREWLGQLRQTVFEEAGGSHSLVSCQETRPNNFGSHCGAARVAIDLYLGDSADLARAATVFAGWLGNRRAYQGFEFGNPMWQADRRNPVGVNPVGATVEGHPVGGALPEEMRRGGRFQWPPRPTGYPWEALQGALVEAELLSRAGYLVWQWEDQALLRSARFLYSIGWAAEGDDRWQLWLLNRAYGPNFPAQAPAEPGKNMGWTDWTHGPGRDAAQGVEHDE
jgi:hypothetical protein